MLTDGGYPKAATRLIWDITNTIIHIIPKYSYYARLIKGKALAIPRSVS